MEQIDSFCSFFLCLFVKLPQGLVMVFAQMRHGHEMAKLQLVAIKGRHSISWIIPMDSLLITINLFMQWTKTIIAQSNGIVVRQVVSQSQVEMEKEKIMINCTDRLILSLNNLLVVRKQPFYEKALSEFTNERYLYLQNDSNCVV